MGCPMKSIQPIVRNNNLGKGTYNSTAVLDRQHGEFQQGAPLSLIRDPLRRSLDFGKARRHEMLWITLVCLLMDNQRRFSFLVRHRLEAKLTDRLEDAVLIAPVMERVLKHGPRDDPGSAYPITRKPGGFLFGRTCQNHQRSGLLTSSPYIRLYCFGVEPARSPIVRLHDPLQGMRPERPCARRNASGVLDCG
jgi:hypothetical protein